MEATVKVYQYFRKLPVIHIGVVIQDKKVVKEPRKLKQLFTILPFIVCHGLFSLDITFHIHTEKSYEKLYLRELVGDQLRVLDSSRVKKKKIHFSATYFSTGFYELFASEKDKVEFVFNGQEEIKAVLQGKDLRDQLMFEDKENQALWEYKYFTRTIQKEEKDLKALVSNNTDLPQALRTNIDLKLDSLLTIKDEYQLAFVRKNKETFIGKVVKATSQDLYNDMGLPYRKKVFFDWVDFSDPALIRSHVFPKLILEYLQVHTEHNENGFKESIDLILQKAKANAQVYSFCLNNLMGIFQRVGPDIIFQYVVENHFLVEGCLDEVNNERLKYSIESYIDLMPGRKAPNVMLTKGVDEYKLSELLQDKEYSILFFWSSHCPFCESLLPSLDSLLEKNSKLNFLTVSLDQDKKDWELKLLELNAEATHFCDLQGWDSQTVKDFKIHKTPTMYLLSKDLTIVSRPTTIEELKIEYSKL